MLPQHEALFEPISSGKTSPGQPGCARAHLCRHGRPEGKCDGPEPLLLFCPGLRGSRFSDRRDYRRHTPLRLPSRVWAGGGIGQTSPGPAGPGPGDPLGRGQSFDSAPSRAKGLRPCNLMKTDPWSGLLMCQPLCPRMRLPENLKDSSPIKNRSNRVP